MHIAHVNDIAFVGSTLVRELRRAGVDARLLEPPRPGASLPYPWKLAVLPFRVAGLIATGLHLRGAAYDLVHVHYARLALIGPVSGQPFIVHCHGSDVRGVTPGSPWGRGIGPLLRRAVLVYYSTPDLRTWVEAFRPDAIFLPNPIDTRRFSPAAAPLPGMRDLLVGVRLDDPKGLDAIIETMRSVVGTRPGTSVTVVKQGAGLRRFRSAVRGDIEYIEPVPQRDFTTVLRRHRIALGQFRVGAIGNYELEALASGLAVVADFRYREAYDEPPPVVQAGSATEAATMIVELLDDVAGLRAVAARGPAWVEAHHSATAIAGRLIEDYRRSSRAERRR